jgi:methyltransferase-like protein/trans-aconitate methyltransferase
MSNVPSGDTGAFARIAASYDALPYDGAPISYSRPERLATLATLAGLAPPDLSQARVLELGCGFGGNLIPLAELWPRAQFVGFDASAKQITGGQAVADQLRLTNLQLRQMDIMELGADLGQFDYIIAHGLYSWVSSEVQSKILQICREHLTPNGLAYISYNTFPGWKLRCIVRDMMNYHASRFDDPLKRVAQARSMISLFAQTGAKFDEPYWNLLKREMATVASKEKPDWYIAHDYMEEDNLPCYFHEFASRAAAAGLQYVGDANPLSRPPLAQMAPEALAAIDGVSTNVIEKEQYVDYICNRTFRASVLCRAELKPDFDFNAERLINLHVSSSAMPEVNNPDVRSLASVNFRNPRGLVTTSSDPVIKGLLLTLAKCWPSSMSYRELIAAALSLAKGKPEAVEEGVHDAAGARLALQIFQLYESTLLDLSVCPSPCTVSPPARPRVTALARLQAAKSNLVTNLRHESARVADLDRRIIPMLDGQHDKDQLVAEMQKLVESGTLNVHSEGQRVHHGPQLRFALSNAVNASLAELGKQALLLREN